MKFSILNIEVAVEPLSTRQSRYVNSNIQDFAKGMEKTPDGRLAAPDTVVARFLASTALYLLRNVYNQADNVPEKVDDFEDRVTLVEICEFLREQVEKSGSSDFLIQPLAALLQGMKKVSDSMAQIVDNNTDAAIKAMKTSNN